tara:strand:- start:445 stop:978 length:534 start_codon:yes stop_codon:yes gene_type:complete
VFLLFTGSNNNKTEQTKQTEQTEANTTNDISYSSNVIQDVYYSSKDIKGNEYIIKASQGEIDYNNPNTIYLTNVNGYIRMANSDDITITSEFGKYNIENFDTIFSKNVIIDYLDNTILGEYLDFSIKRSSMLMSRKIIYTNINNILEADAIEINLDTKDTRIYMFQNDNKVNIRSKK